MVAMQVQLPSLPRRGGRLTPLFALLVLASGCATGGASAPADGSVARLDTGSAALAVENPLPDVERLRSDVAWLADDAREGRRAGTPGERAAAEWIARRMEELGLEPVGTDGYLQSFEVPLPARDGGTSMVVLSVPQQIGEVNTLFREPEEVVPLFCSDPGEAEGRLVFAGYGIEAPEADWDDYDGLDLDGAVVLVVRGTPAVDPPSAPTALENPHGDAVQSTGWGNHGSIFHKVMQAKRRGASAVLVAAHPDAAGDPLLDFDAGRTARARIPALMVSASVAAKLVPDYRTLVAAHDAAQGAAWEPSDEREIRVAADVVRASGTAHNVLGRIRGREPGRAVVIGAHFDHLGHGGPGSLAPDARGEIHNGADDNASGTAVALEVARLLQLAPPAGDVVIALWSGEELGLLGSEHWARNPTVDWADLRSNINLDMVGRAGSGKLNVLGAGTAEPLAGWLEAAGPKVGLELAISRSGQGIGGSDHQTFIKRSVPALHFFSGIHSDYHRPSDDVEGFEAQGAVRVTELCLAFLARMQAADELAWAEPVTDDAEPTPGGFRTRFGSIPDYVYDGKGMRLDGTSAGGPAERAGLLRGDVILSVDDLDIDGVGDFMFALNSHKPGDVVLVKFLRDGEKEECRVTLESTQVE